MLVFMKSTGIENQTINEDGRDAGDQPSGSALPAGGASRRPEGGSPPAASPMALSVTRHREITGKEKEGIEGKDAKQGPDDKKRIQECPFIGHENAKIQGDGGPGSGVRFLAAGIDTLDLGLWVKWGANWRALLNTLQQKKEQAAGTSGVPLDMPVGPWALVMPSGKPPMYRFHLELPDAHLFIAKARESGLNAYPNVYVSFRAASLWCSGVHKSVRSVVELIKALWGRVNRIQVSRADLCADFLIPGGLSLEFLRSHIVAQSNERKHFESSGRLETLYVGKASGAIQLRIYDKGRQLAHKGVDGWLLKIWDRQSAENVWRVEYQLRRSSLRQLRVDHVGHLLQKWGGMWKYLTQSWASVRLPDNENTSRRTVHPWWELVQTCGGKFADREPMKRHYAEESLGKAAWYVAHIEGYLASYAALKGVASLPEAMSLLDEDLRSRVSDGGFALKVARKAVHQGREISREALSDE